MFSDQEWWPSGFVSGERGPGSKSADRGGLWELSKASRSQQRRHFSRQGGAAGRAARVGTRIFAVSAMVAFMVTGMLGVVRMVRAVILRACLKLSDRHAHATRRAKSCAQTKGQQHKA